jgi:hypothetical protein
MDAEEFRELLGEEGAAPVDGKEVGVQVVTSEESRWSNSSNKLPGERPTRVAQDLRDQSRLSADQLHSPLVS